MIYYMYIHVITWNIDFVFYYKKFVNSKYLQLNVLCTLHRTELYSYDMIYVDILRIINVVVYDNLNQFFCYSKFLCNNLIDLHFCCFSDCQSMMTGRAYATLLTNDNKLPFWRFLSCLMGWSPIKLVEIN